MQTITIQGYDFAELSESAKTNAANTLFCEHFWGAESIESIRSFCAHFGVTLTDYSYDTCSYNYTTDASNASFRGYTLKQAKVLPEWPTGYCMDCTLRENFISWFEKPAMRWQHSTALWMRHSPNVLQTGQDNSMMIT